MNVLDPQTRWCAAVSRLGLVIFLASAGCVGPTALDDLPCPCAAGWACCVNQNVCVREGATCPDPSPRITPAAAQVRFGGTLDLSAGEAVTWSIEEGALGGQITATGRYTAPLRPGPFHLIATSITHPERTTRIEIAVGPTRLEVLAGRIGGTGQLDGIGADARFGEMGGIVGDGAGHLYVTSNYGGYYSQSGSNPKQLNYLGYVRRVDLATSAVSTVARVPVVNSPALGKLAMDTQGKLYSTTGAREVVRIDPVSGAVTTLLPADPNIYLNGAITISGNSLYFVRSSSPLGLDIARVDLATGMVQSVAGSFAEDSYRDGIGADARIHRVNGLVTDATGAILFADEPIPAMPFAPCVLRKLDPATREVTTVTGLSSCPSGLVIDAQGLLYTAKGNINAATGGEKERMGIKQVTKRGYPYFLSAWSVEGLTKFETSLASPLYIEGDMLYTADNPHSLIRKSGPLRTGEHADYGTVGVVDGFDKLLAGAQPWIANSDGQGQVARFDHPSKVIADSHGNVYVAELLTGYTIGRARVISEDGTVRTVGGIPSPYVGLAVSTNDRVFVMSSGDYLSEITPAGIVQLPFIIVDGGLGPKAFYGPQAITADDRAVYVLDTEQPTGNRRIRRYDLATHEVRTLATLPSESGGWNVVLTSDGAGNVLSSVGTKVYRTHGVTGATTAINLGSATFDGIKAVAYDPCGIFYVADAQHVRAIVESTGEGFDLIGTSGGFGVRTGALPAFLSEVSGLSVLPSGALAVSTSSENAVLIAR